MFERLFLILFILLPGVLSAQIASLQGTVIDSVSREKLPFVTILINDSQTRGTSTDADGSFVIKGSDPVTSLTVSYVGYQTKRIAIQPGEKVTSIVIELTKEERQLEDVIVVAGENPAHRIIRMAVRNRDRNNYTRLNSYLYKAYEKFTINGYPPDTIYSDSLRAKVYRFLQSNHLLVLEAIVEHKFIAPDLVKETVLAQNVSGLNAPNFTVLTSQFQTTNFYEPYINIATTDFVNPVSPNSWDKYFFNIEDTLYEQSDTVFVISYHPARGKNFAALEGVLKIHSAGYAIQQVTARPADTLLASMHVRIEQHYARADSIHWFPTYLESNLTFRNFFWEGLSLEGSSKTYIREIQINPTLLRKDFDGVGIDLMDDLKKDDSYWTQNRADTLTAKEQRTYYVLDSLNRRYHFDRKLAWASAWQDGLLRFPYVSVQIENTIKFNKPEGMRIGLGLETNRDFSKRYVLSGFAGYGIRDELWKYGGSVKWKIMEPKNIALKFSSSTNYEENGGLSFFQNNYWGSLTGVRNYTITKFDYVNRQELSFTARIRKAVNIQATTFTAFKQITDDYLFLDESGDEPRLIDEFRFSGFQAALRWSYKERVVESFDHYYWINTGHPVLWLQVTQGIEGFLQGDFTYTKYEGQLAYAFNTKSFGITSFTFNAGIVDGTIPSTDLYAGRSSYSFIGLYAPGSFQTMRSGEFMNDRFAALYFKQDFLNNVIRWGRFQPNFQFVTNIGWGQLHHQEVHVNSTFQSMEKGYFESGIVMNSLVAKRFFGIVRVGLGAGVFYRYGPYAFVHEIDNFAFKFTLAYNIK
jgi:hypothetical protein